MNVRLRMMDMNQHKCKTCSHGRVTEHTSGQVLTYCSQGTTRLVPGEVTECSGYNFRYEESPYAMDRIAWLLEVKDRKIMGFKPPKVRPF